MSAWPKLSETLPQQRHPWVCQACGFNIMPAANEELGISGGVHEIWRECDDRDKPTRRVVILCAKCAERLIEPHPRLYHHEPENKPVPGAMPHLCVGCRWARDLGCTHPLLTANGGAGLLITVALPVRGFWDGTDKHGRRTGGMYETWSTPASACAGAQPPDDDDAAYRALIDGKTHL